MRALVLHEFGGPLRMEERPLPQPGHGEALLRVQACAVDQFDLTIRDGKWPGAKVPLVLGHEVAGEVEEIGPGVLNVAPGDRVASTLYLTCGACKFCRTGRETLCLNFGGHLGAEVDGGFAEYMTLPADMLVPVADSISFEEASVLANALGTPYHAVKVRAGVMPGETYEHTLRCLAVGGRMVIIGSHMGFDFSLPALQVLTKEWEILGSRNTTKQELAEVADLVGQGMLKPIVSRIFSFEEVEEAHRLLRQGEITGRAVVRI